MAEVPDHLVPTDGLTNSSIRFDQLAVNHGHGSVTVSFGIYGPDQAWIADFPIEVANGDDGADGVIARAHQEMRDVLRQWLYMTDVLRQQYEKRLGIADQEGEE